jgi:hypothetical protein
MLCRLNSSSQGHVWIRLVCWSIVLLENGILHLLKVCSKCVCSTSSTYAPQRTPYGTTYAPHPHLCLRGLAVNTNGTLNQESLNKLSLETQNTPHRMTIWIVWNSSKGFGAIITNIWWWHQNMYITNKFISLKKKKIVIIPFCQITRWFFKQFLYGCHFIIWLVAFTKFYDFCVNNLLHTYSEKKKNLVSSDYTK